MNRPVRPVHVVLAFFVALAALLWMTRSPQPSPVAAPLTAHTLLRPKPALPASNDADWQPWLKTVVAGQSFDVVKGRELALQRHERMQRLIRENPRQAIAEAVSPAEYAALPKEIQPFVEMPFSERVEFVYLPICGPSPDGRDAVVELHFKDGRRLEAYAFGSRAELMGKRSLPVQGVSLDGMAALNDAVFQILSAADLETTRPLYKANAQGLDRSFATGQPIQGAAVLAVAGGELFAFANSAEVTALDEALRKLDTKPGPYAASERLFLPYSPDAATATNTGFDLSGAAAFAAEQASAWTETEKKVYLIRVDFSDNVGGYSTQSATVANLTTTSDHIRTMSYNKTFITATVSTNVYRMPQTAAYYANGGNGLNTDLLRDGRNTFRNSKSGADAAINIGAVDNTGSGGTSLGDYDIVGVAFSSIGMMSGGVNYAGLAGGGNLWMQGSISVNTFTHEFGHNYGIGHASFWQTSDGSVTGTGSSVEYGDDFDVMGGGSMPQAHYHTQAKAKLDWLTSAQWADATALGSNTYRIYRIDDRYTTGTYRGVRVTKVATPGSEEYYWLGYRPLYTTNAVLSQGAYLNWQQVGQTRCWLLDTTPATSGNKTDAGVPVGRTYSDTTANVHITPLATGGSGSDAYLDVQVNVGAFAGNHAPTSGAMSGPTSLAVRTSATFSVSGSDTDGDTLSYYWNTADGVVRANTNSLSLNWTVGGTYNVSVTVSDMKGGSTTVSKTVTVTDPIDTWATSAPGGTYMRDLTTGKGRLVAAEYFGDLYFSWDGVTWSLSGQPANFDKEPKLAYGNNTFVVGGLANSGGAIFAYSPDGRQWATATYPNGLPQVRDIAFGNGKFVAVAEDGVVFQSTDGRTWTTLATVSGLPDFHLLTWSGSTWIAVEYTASGAREEVVWTSPDAVTWTQRSNRGFDIDTAFTFGSTSYLTGWYGGIEYSTDGGVTWSAAQTPGATRWTTYQMAQAPDGTLLCTAKAMDESGTPYALLVSTDGTQWSRTTVNSGNTAVGNANAITFAHGRFITVEDSNLSRRSDILFPTNAAPTASFLNAPASGTARSLTGFDATASDADGNTLTYAWDFGSNVTILDGADVAVNFSFGGTYPYTLRVSDGRGGISTLSGSVTVSDPARTFTQRTSGTTNALNAIAANSTTLVAAGGGGVIRSSTDGQTWTTRTVTEFATNISFQDVIWDGSQFVLVGYDYNFTISGWVSVIYTSPDGATWTRRLLGSTANTRLYGIAASSGGVLVACGEGGLVLRSTNSTSWSSISGLGTSTFRGIARNSSTFVLTGYSGGNGTCKIWTSTDGQSWVDATSSSADIASWQDLRRVAWLNDRFVASGWYSKLRVSTNNGASFTTNRSSSEELPGMAYGNGVYIAVGVDHSNADAAVDVLSLNGTDWLSYTAPTTNDRNDAVFFANTFITVGSGGEIWQSAVTSAAGGFAAWQGTNFPGGGASALATADPDGDGLVNTLEYALALTPSSANTSGLSAQLNGGTRVLRLNLPATAPGDVIYTIEGSTSLSSWSPLATKTGSGTWVWLGGGTSRLAEGTPASGRLNVDCGPPDSASGAPAYFLRLNVQVP